MKLDKSQYYQQSELIKLGWTAEMIKYYIPHTTLTDIYTGRITVLYLKSYVDESMTFSKIRQLLADEKARLKAEQEKAALKSKPKKQTKTASREKLEAVRAARTAARRAEKALEAVRLEEQKARIAVEKAAIVRAEAQKAQIAAEKAIEYANSIE